MQNEHDRLSEIIKTARQKSELTMEELAAKIGVTERYLYRIENENKKPSYDVLYKLIRVLSISPEAIFYPDQTPEVSEVDSLIRTLYRCDPRSLNVIRATLQALIDTADNDES